MHTITSPRLQSTSSSKVSTTLCGAYASGASPPSSGARAIRLTRVSLPEGRMRTRSPGFTLPAAICPANPRKLRSGRNTNCTGIRKLASGLGRSTGTASRSSSTGLPLYHGVCSLRFTTLSPFNALIGTATGSGMPMRAQKSTNSRSMARNRSSLHPTMSILLTAATTWRIPNRLAINACRRVCVVTPLRASIRLMASWQ